MPNTSVVCFRCSGNPCICRVTHCEVCGNTLLITRSPKKGYKQTLRGCLCDECYSETIITRVLEFGCAAEHYGGYGNVQTAIDIFHLADRLWNELVEIEHYNRVEFRRLTSDATLEARLKAHDDAIEALQARIKQQKGQERRKNIKVDQALLEQGRVLKEERKLIYEALRLARIQMKKDNSDTLAALGLDIARRYTLAMKQQHNGLNYCIRNSLLRRFKIALISGRKNATAIVKRKLNAGRKVTGFEGLPRPRRSDGTGIITVPFTNGLTVSKARVWDDRCGKFQIHAADPIFERMTSNRSRGQAQFAHHRRQLQLCRLAVATDSNRRPEWLTLPVIFHRPLPETADIRNVVARRELMGGKAHWKLYITIRSDKRLRTGKMLSCGVNVGWRKRNNGDLRVAYVCDESGHHEELLLPASDIEEYRKLHDLQGIMRSKFNAIRGKLADWLQVISRNDQGGDEIKVSPLVLEACSTDGAFSLDQWKSASELIRLKRVWDKNRFPGDEQMWDEITRWLYGESTSKIRHMSWKGDLSWSQARRRGVPPPDVWNGHQHFYVWRQNLSDQLCRRRRERYRIFAARLVKEYGTIFIEDFELRGVIQKPPPEFDTVDDSLARFQRSTAAISVLRKAIESACLREGVRLVKVNSRNLTHTCAACGAFFNFNAAKALTCKCKNCGAVQDQDYIAAKNVLGRGLAMCGSGSTIVFPG